MKCSPTALARGAALLGVIAGGGHASAAAVYYSFDLHGGALGATPTPFITVVQAPGDSNGDGWHEALLKINLRDPGLANPYHFAEFRISYDAAPAGLSVNIGDSATNNGGGGDAGTQSNDAELQIGSLLSNPAATWPTLVLFGNDASPEPGHLQGEVGGFAGTASDVFLTIGNRYVAWNNGLGLSGSITSDHQFALDGQADSEGAVNYDFFAGFNRSVDGGRFGHGVAQVTVCLSTDASCFSAIPAPGSLPLALLALGLAGVPAARRWALKG